MTDPHDELRRLRAELEDARRRLHLQENLLGIVGHDLRTPLSAIVLAAALIERRGPLTPDQARARARIQASAARMNGILRDLLEFSRQRSDGALPLDRQPTRLDEICARTAREIADAFPASALDVAVQPVQGCWDPLRLEQAVSNLIANALQHGIGDEPVRVRGGPRGDEAVLEVRNFGEPIPPALLPRIFDAFRGGGRRGGYGLGLYIVREIAAAHGGRVEVESSADEGTVFRIRLPLGDPDQPSPVA